MTAKHKQYAMCGTFGSGNRIRTLINVLGGMSRLRFILSGLFMWAAVAHSAPPYDITVTFNAPSTGGTVGGYNLYLDDCAVTGATGAPLVAGYTSGTLVPGALTADGIYQVCVRSFNSTGEILDPGPVATVDVSDLPLPGPIENLDVQVGCPNGGCTVTVTVN